jgi:hypothetical protein
MKQEKTFAAINKLKDVELELYRLKNALEMANRALDAIRADEREACAKLCESHVSYPSRLHFAAAIRARSDK